MRIFAEAVGVIAPGLPNWSAARNVLGGRALLQPAAPVIEVTSLPPAERRRSSPTVRLSLAAAEQALAATSLSATDMAMVFASYEAAGVITHQLCEVLAGTREVSPTQFHNSVHNAPSGYCSIAMQVKHAASSVCRGPWSFAAGLLNAAAVVEADGMPVLFVCYDSPLPQPMADVMPMIENTAIALVLSPQSSAAALGQWVLELAATTSAPDWPAWMPDTWHANASARGFALLQTLADTACNTAVLPLGPDLCVKVTQC